MRRGLGRHLYRSVSAFGTAAAAVTDAFFKYVTLLLPGNGTNGAQNNTFIDSSTNAFTITRNGNTTQGTFSPYGANWSNYFSANGQNLSCGTSTNLALGSGNYTVECWVYLTSYNASTSALIDWRTAGGSFANVPAIGISATGTLNWYESAPTVAIASSSVIPLNTWTHIALARSGTAVTMYFNGASVGTATSSANLGIQTLSVNDPQSLYGTIGYISNVRIIKGTAVYTGAFTPSTTPLTAISGTSLLTCQSNRFIDNSSNAFAITATGSPTVQVFSPFSPSAAYSTATVGGSGYFDGSGDYLSLASNAALQPGAGDFTFECWVNPQSTAQINLYCAGDLAAGGGFAFYAYAPPTSLLIVNDGVSTITDFRGLPAIGVWTHVAVVRSSGSIKFYINGVGGTSTASAQNFNSSSPACYVGAVHQTTVQPTQATYISNARLVKGTAVYTANFTPPTAPLTAITNTSLLLSTTNAGVIDNAMMNDLETVGNAQISTTQSKFGGASIAFNGTTDYLTIPDTTNLELGSGDFTIECWLYLSTLPTSTNRYTFVGKWLLNQYSYIFQILNNAGTMQLVFGYTTNGSAATTVAANASIVATTWFHTAVVRNGTNLKIFFNGTEVTSAATISGTLFDGTAALNVGRNGDNSQYFPGYIDDLRITKGYARYTANFTPPSAAFPVQ